MKIKFDELISELLKDKKKLGLAIIITLAVLYIDFSFVLKFQTIANRALNKKIVKLKSDLKNLENDLDRMKVSAGKTEPLKVKRIISQDEISWLIEEIYNLSHRNNVKILQVNPGTTATAAKNVAASRYITVPLNISLASNYQDLVKFIDVLESHPVIMAVDYLEIMRDKDNIFFHTVRLTLNTYVKM